MQTPAAARQRAAKLPATRYATPRDATRRDASQAVLANRTSVRCLAVAVSLRACKSAWCTRTDACRTRRHFDAPRFRSSLMRADGATRTVAREARGAAAIENSHGINKTFLTLGCVRGRPAPPRSHSIAAPAPQRETAPLGVARRRSAPPWEVFGFYFFRSVEPRASALWPCPQLVRAKGASGRRCGAQI